MQKELYLSRPRVWKSGAEATLPDLSFLSPMVRRRLSDVEKISLFLANESAPAAGDFQSVFASRFGEWHKTIQLIQQFYAEQALSPTGFSLSVHNAAAGYYSLITHNQNSYTSIAAGKKTLEMGILEALLTPAPVLFVYAEEKTPDFYLSHNPPNQQNEGLSFFLTAQETDFPISVTFEKNEKAEISFGEVAAFLNGQTKELKAADWSIRRR